MYIIDTALRNHALFFVQSCRIKREILYDLNCQPLNPVLFFVQKRSNLFVCVLFAFFAKKVQTVQFCTKIVHYLKYSFSNE